MLKVEGINQYYGGSHILRGVGFEENEVAFVKRPDQGKMKDVAFIKDADGYWIEIVEPGRLKNLGK